MRKICALLSLLVLIGGIMAQAGASDQAAHFTFGTTRFLAKKSIGPQGGRMEIRGSGSPLEGMILEIPAGALDQEVIVRVGCNDGTLSLPSGAPSGMVAVIEFGQAPSLAQPATITVPFDAKKTGGPVQGYTINDQGGLDLLMLARLDRTAGQAAFHAFRSLTMTWVYLEM
ncbi:hypothetical protein [Desulfolutivibrio sp.]|uniref:hypothetical protein n=1 Tax=Desulfolutivibrio sp. TaxID=2773296 RepID=UPI002F966685